MKRLLNVFYLSSLNVVFAAGICSAAFFKLPDGNGQIYFIPILQLMLCTWLIYILDRLIDIKNNCGSETERHRFHSDHQFNFQVVAVGLVVINVFLLFFEPAPVVIGGGIIAFFAGIYLLIIVSKRPALKEPTMPFLFTLGIIFAPFVLMKNVSLSSWILAFMFLLIIYQNLFIFTAFEQGETDDENKWRKMANYLGALNLFLYIVFFSSRFNFPNQFALIICIISLIYSAILTKSESFKNSYRWIMDGLLFLPLLLIFL